MSLVNILTFYNYIVNGNKKSRKGSEFI